MNWFIYIYGLIVLGFITPMLLDILKNKKYQKENDFLKILHILFIFIVLFMLFPFLLGIGLHSILKRKEKGKRK